MEDAFIITSPPNGGCKYYRLFLPAALFLVSLSGCMGDGRKQTEKSSSPSQPWFVDVAEQAGVRYEWRIPGKRPLNILQTIGNGCAFLDYNQDGNLDILLVGPNLALFRGDGRGAFKDSTKQTLLDRFSGHYLGCAVGDLDGDGFPDLYISGFREGLLLRNQGGRDFEDVTAGSGLKPEPWGTSCGFAETAPGSGRLDLYVANYAVFGPDVQPQLCPENGILTSCGPRHYKPLAGTLYASLGGFRFRDTTKGAGAESVHGRGLGVAWADFDGSGKPGLAIANDELPGDLLKPAVSSTLPRFENIGDLSGTAYDRDGNVHGGMGIDWGDYDGDGLLDLFVTTFQKEVKNLYRNEGEGRFTDMAIPTGVSSPTLPFVAFGCKFVDVDNDGWLDLVIANGHVQDNIQKIDSSTSYRQSGQLLRNRGSDPPSFEDASGKAGPDLQRPIVGRGLATGDYDNDGRIDMLIVDSEGKPLLLHNENAATGHWLGARLVGTKSNRDGYGAVLTVEAGGRTLTRQCQSGGSYMSASDPRVHFGLGSPSRVDRLTVRWPSGRSTSLSGIQADRYVTITEPR